MNEHSRAIDADDKFYSEQLRLLGESAALRPLAGRVVVVLGATGALGTATLRSLSVIAQRAPDTRVIGVARGRTEVPSSIQFVPGSVTDPETYARLPRPDYVVYVAGSTSDYLARAVETVDTTVNGLLRAVDYARDCEGFALVSSTRVYGQNHTDGVLTEATAAITPPMSLGNIYDSSKRLAESLLLWASEHRDLPATVVRLTNVYGPYAAAPKAGAIGQIVGEALRTGRVTVRGNPASVRNYCYVSDAVAGLLAALVSGRRAVAYNIGSDEHRTNLDFIRMVVGHLPRRVEVTEPSCLSTADPMTARISIARARTELDYQPRASLRECLPHVVEWTYRTLAGAGAEMHA